MRSLYYILNKKHFASNKNGEHKQYFIITVIACNETKLTGEKSYDKWVDQETYNKVEINGVYEIYFDLAGKLENVIVKILGTVKVQLNTDISTKFNKN